MPVLAEVLSSTTLVSPLVRKAKRLGFCGNEAMIHLAGIRGCRHYASSVASQTGIPTRSELTDAELTILLMAGESPYDPATIRCAAQLARSPHVKADNLARLAKLEKSRARTDSHGTRRPGA